MAIAMNNILFW